MTDVYARRAEELLRPADVRIGGDRPWDLEPHDPRVFRRVYAQGSLGLGEAYMDGWWDCRRLDEFFTRVLRADLARRLRSWRQVGPLLRAQLWNLQSRRRAFDVGRRHYDIGNRLYQRMLDERMIYSCGYWRDADTLDAAQEAKLDLVCRKLGLEPGMRVLDIGCGWGGAARYAAERYGAEVVGITVSKEQAEFAREHCAGLPVTFILQDYRELEGRFDRVFSLGMFEHVGRKNYGVFMDVVRGCLADDGLFLLHTIGGNHSVFHGDGWIERYIFPNGMLPSAVQIARAVEGRFVIEDWHNFGPDYDRTLMAWHENFENAWDEVSDRYDERFHRMWRYYLLSCAGTFRSRKNQVWQVLLSPGGVPGGCRAPR